MTVGLFVPCYIDQFYPEVSVATLKPVSALYRFKIRTSRSKPFTFTCVVLLLIMGVSPISAHSQTPSERHLELPKVIGYGEGRFIIGDEIYSNDLETNDDWLVQIQNSDTEAKPRVDFGDGGLDVLMPGRGATIWNRNKFSGSITITYKVRSFSTHAEDMGIVVRDINSFWHASDPDKPEAIFNSDKYTGAFDSYHTQHGYYASMGGRDNTTTRFRRYPRVKNGRPVDHISLSERDGLNNYLIQPGKTHTIQLVAFDDLIQFIVDGDVFYEIREGDSVTITKADGSEEEVTYTKDRFPPYNEGWFGFRLVNTHHQYSDFRVYRLEPVH